MRSLIFIIILFCFPLISTGAEECLECHDKYKKTDHGKLDCVVCHSDIKDLPHAEKLLKPGCVSCHGEAAKQYRVSIHAQKGFVCTRCHNVHNPAGQTKKCLTCHPSVAHRSLPSARKHLAAVDCTGCHARGVRGHINVKVYTGKEPIAKGVIDKDGNGSVDEKEWKDFLAYTHSLMKEGCDVKRTYSARGSAHSVRREGVSCNDCHLGSGVFKKATVEVVGAERLKMPLDPHSVIPRLPLIGLYKLTSHGQGGVACRDCHVSQEKIGDSICSKCHGSVYRVYKGTVHAKGSAANCTDCHDPHKVKTYRELGAAERISVCARCHTDYMEKHKWLPNTELHFKYLECSTCHSPFSAKSMVLTINVETPDGERKLGENDVAAVFGPGKPATILVDKDADRRVVSSELVPFFTALRKEIKGNVSISGSIIVTQIHHDYSQVQKRDKVCATCHSEEAPFYHSIYLALPERDGLAYVPVKGTVLSAMPSSLFMNTFLLGETKISLADIRAYLQTKGEQRREMAGELGFKWIDLFGILLSLVVLFLVCVHIVVRIVVRK